MITIRARLFTGLILITIVGFVYLTYWVVADIRVPSLRGTEESLVECAGILATLVGTKIAVEGDSVVYKNLHDVFDPLYQRKIGALLYGEAKEHIENRVYITNKQGIVLFDSYNGKDEGKDYSQWNDVYLTLKGRYGARASQKDPFDPGTPYIYVGAPIMVGDTIVGVLSVGKPSGLIGNFIKRTQYRFILIVVIAFLIIALSGIFLTIWVSRPIEKLTAHVRAVAKGETARVGSLGKGFLYGKPSEIDTMGEAVEEMRQALEGRQYVEHYVQMLAHAIKAPVSSIVAASDVLDRFLDTEQGKGFNNTINEDAESIKSTIHELLDLVRLECRKELTKTETVQIDAMVRDVIRISKPTGNQKQVAIQEGSIAEVSLQGDRSLLISATRNLVENAIEFSLENDVITVSVHRENKYVSIIVEDTGTGIPDYAKNKIFEKYYSLKRPDTHKASSGLGLNFVKEVASLHQGAITITNRPDKGVQAILKIPVSQ